MKLFILAFLATIVLALPAFATQEPATPQNPVVTDKFVITTTITGCDRDMRRWCRSVTAGKNRPLMCLLAHEDKLRTSCELGILEAALANEAASGALGSAFSACQSERVNLCGHVGKGQGELARCIRDNEDKIGPVCVTELKRTGLWELLHSDPVLNTQE